MKKILLTLAAIGLTSSAFAQTAAVTFESADTDTSATVTLAEAQAAWPDLTKDAFDAADTNKDGALDKTEFDAYVAALPAAQ
ncbi:hypothetical protein [Devosia sp.]|uniref:hypothetical protein n=1 Tax=Devosia sp. TaxID=1871048 RepID=UPI003BAD7F40